MKNVKQAIYTLLSTDSQLQTLLGGTVSDTKIYPMISDTFELFPCITYKNVSGGMRIYPPNVEDLVFEFSIYCKNVPGGGQDKVEDIFTRLDNLLNYYGNQFNPVVYVLRTVDTDLNESDRQLFRKVVRYRIWAKN